MNPPPSGGGYCVCWVSLNAATRVSRLVDHTCTVVSLTAEVASRVPSGLNAMLLILLAKPVVTCPVIRWVATFHSSTASPGVLAGATASVFPSGLNASAARPLTGSSPASFRAGMLYSATTKWPGTAVLSASVFPSGLNARAIELLETPPRVAPRVSHSAMVPSLLALASVAPSGLNAMCSTGYRWPANAASSRGVLRVLRTSHSRTEPSKPDAASCVLLGLNATDDMLSALGAFAVAVTRRLARLHSLTA